MKKTALITGIAGQDGSYLAALLIEKGYTVHGVTRDASKALWRHGYLGITNKTIIHPLDLTDLSAVKALLTHLQPDEMYHLAAQSSVAASLIDPYPTIHGTTLSTLNLLEATLLHSSHTKIFLASSADILNTATTEPLSLRSHVAPTTPYGAAKAAAHFMVQSYRQHKSLYAVNGILFPHESPLRHPDSFTKSLIRQALKNKLHPTHPILLGNIDNKRDFGSAAEFVVAMHASLQQEQPRDYIIGTGVATSIKAIAEYVCDAASIPRDLIVSDTKRQSAGTTAIYADTRVTFLELGWTAQQTIFETIDSMIEFEERTHPLSHDY